MGRKRETTCLYADRLEPRPGLRPVLSGARQILHTAWQRRNTSTPRSASYDTPIANVNSLVSSNDRRCSFSGPPLLWVSAGQKDLPDECQCPSRHEGSHPGDSSLSPGGRRPRGDESSASVRIRLVLHGNDKLLDFRAPLFGFRDFLLVQALVDLEFLLGLRLLSRAHQGLAQAITRLS